MSEGSLEPSGLEGRLLLFVIVFILAQHLSDKIELAHGRPTSHRRSFESLCSPDQTQLHVSCIPESVYIHFYMVFHFEFFGSFLSSGNAPGWLLGSIGTQGQGSMPYSSGTQRPLILGQVLSELCSLFVFLCTICLVATGALSRVAVQLSNQSTIQRFLQH